MSLIVRNHCEALLKLKIKWLSWMTLTHVLCWRNVWRVNNFGRFCCCSVCAFVKSVGCSLHGVGEYTGLLVSVSTERAKGLCQACQRVVDWLPLGNYTRFTHKSANSVSLQQAFVVSHWKHRIQLLNRCLVWRMAVMSWVFFFSGL